MITDETKQLGVNSHTHDCWVCDRDVYSLILWNEEIGKAQMKIISEDDKNYF